MTTPLWWPSPDGRRGRAAAKRAGFALLLVVLCCLSPPQGGAREFEAEMIPTAFVEDGAPVRLELLVRRPSGSGPYPTVIFNHGAIGGEGGPEAARRRWAHPGIAKYFNDRGWMVVFPQRRGRGNSGGRYGEGLEADGRHYSCEPALSLGGLDRAIDDMDAVVAHVLARPDVKADRILIAGQSRGGALAVAYAGRKPEAFAGVLNFVGIWAGPRCPAFRLINGDAYGRGAAFPRPMLWLYGERDHLASLAESRSGFDAFVAAGGKGRFHSFTVPGRNAGHQLIWFPDLWRAPVDEYLRGLN